MTDRPRTPRGYANHVARLAKELGAVTESTGLHRGMMYVEEDPPRVDFLPITDVVTYYVALHELGHVAHGHGQGRPPHEDRTFYFENGVIRSEAQAWEWAFDHARKPLPPALGERLRHESIESYIAGGRFRYGVKGWWWGKPEGPDWSNGNRHYVEFAYDEPDEYVHSVLARFTEGK